MLEKVYAPNAPTFSQLSQTLDELRDGVIVGSLTAFRRERIENGGFRLFQIGQREDAFWRLLFLSRSRHWQRPP